MIDAKPAIPGCRCHPTLNTKSRDRLATRSAMFHSHLVLPKLALRGRASATRKMDGGPPSTGQVGEVDRHATRFVLGEPFGRHRLNCRWPRRYGIASSDRHLGMRN
jgi:hypothetical protein